uniref:Calcium-activated outward-rectifying potassium channel 1 n=1 Tax=Anthurium amnicola TaxID=1678845 RepID=A0A1D1Z2P6_9ARAE
MANDFVKQPLLPRSLDSPHQPPTCTTAKKRRYRRCRSAPSVDVLSHSTIADGPFPDAKFILGQLHPSMRQVIVFLVIYLGVGTVCFFMVKHQIKGNKTNGVIDSLYFCIVTMTTVGYGDLVPESISSKLLACAFVFTGMAIVALVLGTAADYLVEKQEVLLVKALHLHNKVGEAKVLKEMATKKVEYKILMTLALLLLLMTTGTIFLSTVEKLSLVDAFYCVCSTITTLGYGDKSFSTLGGRIFAVLWILTSTICLAQFFLYLAELNIEHRQQLLAKLVLNRRMTFVDLEAADIDEDGTVGAADFIIYKLKEMGKITQEDIALVMEEFEDLDVDQSGTLSANDLLIAQSSS